MLEIVTIQEQDSAKFQEKVNAILKKDGKEERQKDGEYYNIEIKSRHYSCGITKHCEGDFPYWNALLEIEYTKAVKFI